MGELVRSHARLGNRAVVCEGISELNFANREQWIAQGWKPGDPTPLDPAMGQATLAATLGLFDNWDGYDDGRIKVILGPHAADFLSTEMLLRVQAEARKRETLVHLHVAQDPRENNATLQRAGLRAIPYLDSIGLLGSDLIAVHQSTATEEEVELVVRRGARMVCCTNSIGIIDGVVPPARLFKGFGGLVALGSDQAPGNNSHNIFAEMRATAMYAKIRAESPLPHPSLAGAAHGDHRGREGAGRGRQRRLARGGQGGRPHPARPDPPAAGAGAAAPGPQPRPQPGLRAKPGGTSSCPWSPARSSTATGASPTWMRTRCGARCRRRRTGSSRLPPRTSAPATCPSWT